MIPEPDRFISMHALEVAELKRVKQLASEIKDNDELRRKLRQANPKLRLGVYSLIKSFLSFEPLSFEQLTCKGRVKRAKPVLQTL